MWNVGNPRREISRYDVHHGDTDCYGVAVVSKGLFTAHELNSIDLQRWRRRLCGRHGKL